MRYCAGRAGTLFFIDIHVFQEPLTEGVSHDVLTALGGAVRARFEGSRRRDQNSRPFAPVTEDGRMKEGLIELVADQRAVYRIVRWLGAQGLCWSREETSVVIRV